jgi:hypothetical protein
MKQLGSLMAQKGRTWAVCMLHGGYSWIHDGDGGACRRCAKVAPIARGYGEKAKET